MTTHILIELAVIAICLTAGGVLKGATGAGAPVVAVPALAAFFDVRFAVMVMLMPNLLTNAWQVFRFRELLPERSFLIPLLVGGGIGICVGTFALKTLSSDTLSLFVAAAVFGYIGLRLARPHWTLPMSLAKKAAFPAGIGAGILQGAAGLSAPVSITFLNAIQMGRERFIATISAFFTTFTSVQVIAVAWAGLLRPAELAYSFGALALVSAGMPLGEWIARRISAKTLDRIILGTLCVLAVKLVFDALA